MNASTSPTSRVDRRFSAAQHEHMTTENKLNKSDKSQRLFTEIYPLEID